MVLFLHVWLVALRFFRVFSRLNALGPSFFGGGRGRRAPAALGRAGVGVPANGAQRGGGPARGLSLALLLRGSPCGPKKHSGGRGRGSAGLIGAAGRETRWGFFRRRVLIGGGWMVLKRGEKTA